MACFVIMKIKEWGERKARSALNRRGTLIFGARSDREGEKRQRDFNNSVATSTATCSNFSARHSFFLLIYSLYFSLLYSSSLSLLLLFFLRCSTLFSLPLTLLLPFLLFFFSCCLLNAGWVPVGLYLYFVFFLMSKF